MKDSFRRGLAHESERGSKFFTLHFLWTWLIITTTTTIATAITTTTTADGTYSLEYTPEEGKEYNVTFAKDNYQTATYPADEVPEPVVLQSVDTGISTIGVDGNDGRIYDLQGRELKSVPQHGIYIQNGKKHVK